MPMLFYLGEKAELKPSPVQSIGNCDVSTMATLLWINCMLYESTIFSFYGKLMEFAHIRGAFNKYQEVIW